MTDRKGLETQTARPLLVAIAGGSGSGKTTLACWLTEALVPHTSRILALDRYYRDLSQLPFDEKVATNFDEPEAIEWNRLYEDLARLLQGEQAEVPSYDFETHSRLKQPDVITPGEVIIIEGLFTLTEARLRELSDFRVYVETSEELCFQRRLRRDTQERGRDESEVRQRFLDHVLPMYRKHVHPFRQYADVIVPGDCSDGVREPLVKVFRESLVAAGEGGRK